MTIDYFRPTAISIATATLKFKDKCLPKNFQTEPLGWEGASGPLSVHSRLLKVFCLVRF